MYKFILYAAHLTQNVTHIFTSMYVLRRCALCTLTRAVALDVVDRVTARLIGHCFLTCGVAADRCG